MGFNHSQAAPVTLTQRDLIKADTALKAGQFIEVGRYVLPIGSSLRPGYGALKGQDSAIGRVYMDLRDTAAAPGVVIGGTVRLDVHDSQDHYVRTIGEWSAEKLATSAADPTKQIPFAELPVMLEQATALVFKVNPDADATISKTNTVLRVDATKYKAQIA